MKVQIEVEIPWSKYQKCDACAELVQELGQNSLDDISAIDKPRIIYALRCES